MCVLLRYSAGGLAAVLATAYVALSAETGMGAFQPAVAAPPAAQMHIVVNRTNKGDREVSILHAREPVVVPSKPAVARERKILEGCDPAFSPLTSSAKANFAGRCMS